jgi:hypothetical protein
MAKASKIERYGLTERALELSVSKNTHEIAVILSEELDGDTISQPTVSRFLAKVRKQRREISHAIVEENLSRTLTTDLEIVDALIKKEKPFALGEVGERLQGGAVQQITVDDQRAAAREIREWLKLKWRFIGVPNDGEEAELAETRLAAAKRKALKHSEKLKENT